MNLINERVKHRVFGTGNVIDVKSNQITVQFADKYGQKKFSYPSVFEKYLIMCDETAQEFVSDELRLLMERISDERSKKEQVFLEEMQRQAEEKKAARKTTAKTGTKTAAKSKTVKTTKTTKSEQSV